MQPRRCLVVQDDGMSTQLALVKKLEGSVHFNDLAHILFDQALLVVESEIQGDDGSLI